MNWLALLFTAAWTLGWLAFLQGVYYGLVKDFCEDPEIQGKASYVQLVWTIGSALLFIFSGFLLVVELL